jgi:hypothetical protein
MQITLIKLSKFISSPTNANQMLISYFQYITSVMLNMNNKLICKIFVEDLSMRQPES